MHRIYRVKRKGSSIETGARRWSLVKGSALGFGVVPGFRHGTTRVWMRWYRRIMLAKKFKLRHTRCRGGRPGGFFVHSLRKGRKKRYSNL